MRGAEVIASMCLATDLGMGFPFEHGLNATLTTMRLCDALAVDEETRARTYYASLLMYAGCTVDEIEKNALFGGSMSANLTHRQFGSRLEIVEGVARALPSPDGLRPRQVWEVVVGLPRAARFIGGHFAALCEVAGMLAERVGLPHSFHGMFSMLTERWDGNGVLKRSRGEDIPLPVRIIQVARDAAYQRVVGDENYVSEVIRSRAGKAFDPEIVATFLGNSREVLGSPEVGATVWGDVLAAEPRPWLLLEGEGIDRALSAIGSFSDLGSPYFAGHSSGVAELAGRAAELVGFPPVEVATIRRAGFVHDVGRTAVSSRIWNKPSPMNADEREQVRLHPYHTERVLARSSFLAQLASVAMAHHERVDGSGYHRALSASALSPASRLLAAADAFHSKVEPRPYRAAFSHEEATKIIARRAEQGGLDPGLVRAIAEVAGQPAPAIERPAGLTDREVEVVGWLARGSQTKQIARRLDISPKTVDRHIQNAYRKMGVSSRAAAALFAAENGLLPR